MQSPNFSKYEFLNAAGFNSAAASVSGNVNSAVSGIAIPGLCHPGSVSLTYSGLAVTVSAPLPFQVMFGDGHMAAASGTVTNQTTTTYTVNFSGVVPVSGSVTAYLGVQAASIQLQPYQVIGPQPGHPDYNPNFVPYTAYAVNVDSLNFVATTGVPDNFTTFEIGRATLAAAATGITLSTQYQNRVSPSNAQQIVVSSGSVNLTDLGYGGKVVYTNGTSTFTLPLASGANGVRHSFVSQTSGTVTVSASGSDIIYGAITAQTATSFTIGQYGFVTFQAQIGGWQIVECSVSIAATGPFGLTNGGTKTSAFPAVTNFLYYCDQTGGSFTVTAPTSGTTGATFGICSIGTNGLTINWNGANFMGDTTNTFMYPEGTIIFSYSDSATRGWVRSL